jgi:hypothetical protein
MHVTHSLVVRRPDNMSHKEFPTVLFPLDQDADIDLVT